ncbi:WD repeat-containing protein 59, partial [Plakobranchus ocellatus]
EQQGYGGRVQNVTSAKDNIPQNYKKPLSEPGQESKQKSKGEDTADVTAEREGLTVQTQLSSQFTVLSTSASVLSSGVMLGPGGSSFTSSDWYQAGRAGRAGTPGLGGGGGGVGGAGGGSAGVAQPLGAVGGNVPSLSGLMSVVSLEQEMDEVQRARFPGIKLDQADFVKRTCVIKLAKASFHMDVHLSFPDNYPVKISPRLNILSSNLDPDTEARVIRAYNESCSRHVKQHVNCVEPCMKQMVQAMERMSTSPLEQTQEERKLMLEKKFAVEKVQVRSPTSPAQSAGVIPMYATGSFIFRIPFPRTSGARFCSNDRLVTFGVPASMKKIQEENEVTPRALSDFMAIMMAQSPWMRNQPSTFGPMGLFYGSSPHSSAEEVSISSFYVEKANKTRHQRHHGQSHYKPHYRPRESMDAGKRVGAGGDRDSERSNRRLQKVWQLVAHMSHPSIRPSPNPDHGPPFAFTPFGRPLLKRMLEHYGRMRDVQTMAMLCCIFWDRHPTPGPRDRDALALQAGPGTSAGSGSGVGGAGGALSLSRNHSRTSLEYGAAAANQGEVLMATSSDSGYYLLRKLLFFS